jgi:hypothetical protein
MWGIHDGMGWWMVFGGLLMLVFWAAIIGLVFWGINRTSRRGDRDHTDSPMEIAKRKASSRRDHQGACPVSVDFARPTP